MGALVELTDDEWGLVKHLFDPPVQRGVKGTIPPGATSLMRSCGSPTAQEPGEEAASALRCCTACLLPLELGQLILVQRGLALI